MQALERRVRWLLRVTNADAALRKTGLRRPLATGWGLLWHPERLRHAWDVRSDYGTFCRQYGFLRQLPRPADPAKRVLFCSLSGWIAQFKLEGMLAKALQLQGYTPLMLTSREFKHAPEYFRAFGCNGVVFVEDYLEQVPREPAEEEARSLLSATPTFRSLLDYQYRGVYVGRHVLSSVSRSLLKTTTSFDDPEVMALVRRFLPDALRYTLAAELLTEKLQPRCAMFLERGYVPFGEFFDVGINRGVDVIGFSHGQRSDALVLRRYTPQNRLLHPFSVSEESWRSIRQMPWTQHREAELEEETRGRYEQGTWFNRKYGHEGKRIKSPEEVRRQLGLNPAKKTAVIFSHVLWDATFFYGQNLFDDYEQWLVETVRAACRNPAVNWVVKLHPDYVFKMKQLGNKARPRDLIALQGEVGKLPDHIKVMEPDTDISTYALFHVADYCLTVRGTIGIEIGCYGVPVITAGTGRYSGLGFTIDSATKEEYLARLLRIQDIPRLTPEQTLLAKKHAYAVFRLRLCEFTSFQPVYAPYKSLGHPLDRNTAVSVRSLSELRQAPDLRRFGAWVDESRQEDYLAPMSELTTAPVG